MSAHILVIEDDNALQEIFRYVLERVGHKCIMAHDGKMAMDYLKKHTPRLIFLDVRLPHISGEKILEYLHEDGRFRYTRIITMSATQHYARLPYVSDFILKPIMPQQIMQITQETFNVAI